MPPDAYTLPPQVDYGRLLGVALSARPRVLLLDEPLAGLAAAERERVTGLMRRLTEHMAVLLVEHDIDRVFVFADGVAVMNEGRVIAEGSGRGGPSRSPGAGGLPGPRARHAGGERGPRAA
jgi:energy-coupling factor transporter ATP-binding protein EcfA2